MKLERLYPVRLATIFAAALCAFGFGAGCLHAVDDPTGTAPAKAPVTHKVDVVYGHRQGAALTMDVFTPITHAKGVGIVWVVSGGWTSSRAYINASLSREMIDSLTNRDYTVFAVVTSSQPMFTIRDMQNDMQHAVRFIRYHSAEYGIDPLRIGIAGGSSGGQLALMQAYDGDTGNPKAKSPVDRISSRIQAAACFFPPTDFLDYGEQGQSGMGRGRLKNFAAAFAFRESDPARLDEIARQISPYYHATADSPPTLIIHGDNDPLVPIQQANILMTKLHSLGVPAKLIVKHGGGHGWVHMETDMPEFADWFDKFLLK